MLETIVGAGYHDDLPNYLKKRVKPTNVVAMLMVGAVAVPFAIITPIYLPKVLTIIPILGILTGLGVLIANYYGGIRYSRLFLAVLPVTQAVLYNMYLCGPTDDPIPSVYLTSLAFALVPFVTFDAGEKRALFLTSLYSLVLIATFPITRNWYTVAADTSVIRYGWLNTVTTILGVATAFGCMIGLVRISKQSEDEIKQSRLEIKEHNQQLLAEREEGARKTKELEAAQVEEQKRQWTAAGLSQVSQIILRDGSKETIFDELLSTVVKYLNANQGGLFIVDRDDDAVHQIRLAACYAYERKKYVEKSIQPGEGLVGQTFLEQHYTYLTEIPERYVRITSGLGQTTPRALLIVPMKVNEIIEGVIELASFREFAEHEIAFVQHLGETIGSHIQSQRMMQSTQQLLRQAQEQSEELRAAEEEMRQNQEELQATQEEMNRRYRALEEQSSQREQELLAQINSPDPNSQPVSS